MSKKWDTKLPLIRALCEIGLDTATVASLVDTTPENLQTVAKRNDISLNGAGTGSAGVVCKIPLRLLSRDPHQPRRVFDEDELAGLAQALATEGQQTPIRFRVSPETWANQPGGAPLMVVHGERRCKAAAIIGLETILGVLDTTEESDSERVLRQVSDNAQRADLTTWDWIMAIEELHQDGMAIREIADQFAARGIKGMSRPVVSNLRRLLQLPDAAQALVKNGKIGAAHGKYLLTCKDTAICEQIAGQLNEQDEAWSVEHLQYKIRHCYEQTHRGLNCWSKAGWTEFDFEAACDGCDHCHKLDSEHAFCTNPVDECYVGHNAAAERRQAAEAKAQREAEEQEELALEEVDIEALKASDPQEAARIEKQIERNNERRERQDERERTKAMAEKATQACRSCDGLDELLVIAMRYLLDDMAHELDTEGEPLTLSQWLERFKVDRIGMLRTLAAESLAGYIDPSEASHIAKMLGLDQTADYREADPQADIEDRAA